MRSAAMRKIGPKPQVQPGDYVARSWGDRHSVEMRTGPTIYDEVGAGFGCTTHEGAERLAALMNAACDLARDHHLIARQSGWKDVDPRDWVAEVIAHAVCAAVETPSSTTAPMRSRELRQWIKADEQDRGLQKTAAAFEILDKADASGRLGDFAGRALLRKEHPRHVMTDEAREIVRGWRGTFDPDIAAAERAARWLASIQDDGSIA